MLVPNRWHRRRRANLADPLPSPEALREAQASRARSLDSRARSLDSRARSQASRARSLDSRARSLGSRARNPSPVIRVACPNRRAANRRVGRELLPQLLSSRPGTFR